MSKIKRDRKVRKGVDYTKLAKVWRVLAEADWLHVAEISRRTGINECTVRFYLDHYFNRAIEEQRIVPQIRLRLVRLKPGMDFGMLVKTIQTLKQIRE